MISWKTWPRLSLRPVHRRWGIPWKGDHGRVNPTGPSNSNCRDNCDSKKDEPNSMRRNNDNNNGNMKYILSILFYFHISLPQDFQMWIRDDMIMCLDYLKQLVCISMYITNAKFERGERYLGHYLRVHSQVSLSRKHAWERLINKPTKHWLQYWSNFILPFCVSVADLDVQTHFSVIFEEGWRSFNVLMSCSDWSTRLWKII